MKRVNYSVLLIQLIVLLSVVACARLSAANLLEKDYQKAFCKSIGGQTEYVLPDKTRVDCLTKEYAIEADFESKWAESIGQALYYATVTGKKPGILIIVEDPETSAAVRRLKRMSVEFNITVWIMIKGKPDSFQMYNVKPQMSYYLIRV